MRILLTNDDGYDAPGLAALWDAVNLWDDVEITVSAPAEAQSGKGQTKSDRVRCRRIEYGKMGRIVVVEGTPADCVRAALSLPGMHRPDWVMSGINRGGNLGVDVYYSGTVGAAREAAIHGIPAIAFSQVIKAEWPDDWTEATRLASSVMCGLIQREAADRTRINTNIYTLVGEAIKTVPPQGDMRPPCWNVNLPCLLEEEKLNGVEVVPVSIDPLPPDYRYHVEDDGVEVLEDSSSYHDRPFAAGTDIAAAFSRTITISPLPI
jgi:5'-nucleotidase